MKKPPFYSLIQNSVEYNLLKNDADSGRVSHAYLFCSPDTLLLTVLSRMFCSYVLYNEYNETVFCDRHADVNVLPAPSDERKETVYTSDINKLIDGLYIRPSTGDKKFYIIDFGATMNSSCQNKLLKTLEEPPPSVHIIINASKKNALLPTVVSRCKCFEPALFTKEQILSGLKQYCPEDEKLDFAASAARGMLEAADKMARDKKYSILFDTAIVSLLTLENSSSVLSCGARLSSYKDKLTILLDFYEIIFRDIVVKNSGQNQLLMLQCYKDDIEKLARVYSAQSCLSIMPLIIKAQKRIKGYGNNMSIIDELLFGIAYNKAKYKT